MDLPSLLWPDRAGHNKYYCAVTMTYTVFYKHQEYRGIDQNTGNHTSKPVLPCSSMSTPRAVGMCAKAPKHTGPDSITAPDVTSTLPHCNIIKVKEGRGMSQGGEKKIETVFLWWGIYTSHAQYRKYSHLRHFLVKLFAFNFIWEMLSCCPSHICHISILCLSIVTYCNSVQPQCFFFSGCSSALHLFFLAVSHYLLPQITPSAH